MIEKLSYKIANEWGRILNASKDDVECYCYGLELLFSTIANIVIMIIISIILGKYLLFLPYIIVYVPLRLYAGGFHARNHLFCIVYSCVSFFVCFIVSAYIDNKHVEIITLIVQIIIWIIFYKYVPVISKNKPLSQNQITTVRKKTAILLLVIFIIWCCATISNGFNIYIIMIFLSEISVAVTVAVGLLKQKG